MTHSLGAIILAAGKGKRMQSQTTNKVASLLHNKPMIRHIVEFMERLGVGQTVVVVGFAKESVMDALDGMKITYAEQTDQLGTGHAVEVALKELNPDITDVIVVYGDDAVLYNKNNAHIISDLIASHQANHNSLTFLTIEQDNPYALGRIVRDEQDNVIGIVEEKNATEEQKKIIEINPGCFVFNVRFLREYIKHIQKNDVSGEYYLTDLVEIARVNSQKMNAVRGGKLLWRGVNTPEELAAAEEMMENL